MMASVLVYISCPESSLVSQSSLKHSHLPTLSNYHVVCRSTLAPYAGVFNLTYNIHTINNSTEDDMLVIQERGSDLTIALFQQLSRTIRIGTSEHTVVMKNWQPFVLGPELAMLRSPGVSCLRLKFSSAKAFVP